jgi:molecular chaperone HtpG
MPASQEAVWYITGENRTELEDSPYLNNSRKEVRVLFLTESIDEFITQHLTEYNEKN